MFGGNSRLETTNMNSRNPISQNKTNGQVLGRYNNQTSQINQTKQTNSNMQINISKGFAILDQIEKTKNKKLLEIMQV